jgi:hypothetical protein
MTHKTVPLADRLADALDASRMALDDWLNTYASEHCNAERVREANDRIMDSGGTLAYIAGLQATNRGVLAEYDAAPQPTLAAPHDHPCNVGERHMTNKTVPREPTARMITAGQRAPETLISGDYYAGVWQAMYDAAPQPTLAAPHDHPCNVCGTKMQIATRRFWRCDCGGTQHTVDETPERVEPPEIAALTRCEAALADAYRQGAEAMREAAAKACVSRAAICAELGLQPDMERRNGWLGAEATILSLPLEPPK